VLYRYIISAVEDISDGHGMSRILHLISMGAQVIVDIAQDILGTS
jgi:uncharacterized protein YutE (UPF0331/DUF86 family)